VREARLACAHRVRGEPRGDVTLRLPSFSHPALHAPLGRGRDRSPLVVGAAFPRRAGVATTGRLWTHRAAADCLPFGRFLCSSIHDGSMPCQALSAISQRICLTLPRRGSTIEQGGTQRSALDVRPNALGTVLPGWPTRQNAPAARASRQIAWSLQAGPQVVNQQGGGGRTA